MALRNTDLVGEVCGLLSLDSSNPPAPVVQAVSVVWQMAKAWTRGRGFDELGTVKPDIGAVIVSSAARLIGNPTQLLHSLGDVSYQSGFAGFGLHEQLILNRYRKRVM